ncbi:MAG: ABC transporter permease subunit [Deltaproteobacteria bacterium]|nr:ABC transporter permease subunit [Deltaproteobacteria bacterium]
MRNTLAIAKKELNVYFTTVIAYSGFGAFAFLMGLVFVSSLNRYVELQNFYMGQQQPELAARLNFNDMIITPMFTTGVWMFLFFVPFLTMRLFAEEKSSRTFELLMSAPIGSFELVLGKFLGVSVIVVTMTALPLVFPFMLDLYGQTALGRPVDWAPVLAASVMFALLGIAFCSVGLLISSLTESQIVASLMTFAILLASFVLPMIAGRLEGDWRAAVEYLSPVAHVSRGIEGRLLVADLTYFTSISVLFVLLTQRVIESHRWR